jgi:hypothetical protein
MLHARDPCCTAHAGVVGTIVERKRKDGSVGDHAPPTLAASPKRRVRQLSLLVSVAPGTEAPRRAARTRSCDGRPDVADIDIVQSITGYRCYFLGMSPSLVALFRPRG